MDGYNFHKINAANAYGGPALSAIAVRELLGGVPIDRYLRVNVQGVEQFVDALGGVTINVPFDMKYQDDSQHLYIDLKAGKQHLNGSQVQQYLRFRHDAQGDIGRVQRQQQLMRAILEQALTPTTIPRLPKLFSVIQHHIDTNLTSKELMALAGFSATTQRSQVGMVMLPGRFSQPEEFDASYWVPNLDEIDTLMAQYFTNNDPAISAAREPEKLMIAIQDGSGHDRNIEPLVEQLGYLGYTNTFIDHSTSEPPQTTQIIAQRGDRASAQALQEALGFGEVRVDSTGNLSSDLTLQVGKDWP
jgi:LCP family protein required for cell wall assembly